MMKKDKIDLLIRILAAAAFLAMVVINSVANIIPIGNISTADVSMNYPNLFAPAPFTFSIWAVIYVLLGIYSVYQIVIFFKNEKGRTQRLVKNTSSIYLITCVLNASWIFAWHYEYIGISMLVMAALITFLAVIMLDFKKHKFTRKENWLIRLPFSVYFGWITIAATANLIAFLVSVGWDAFGLPEVFWTVAVLILAAVIGIAAIISYHDGAYGSVLVWSYAGILYRHIAKSGFDGMYPQVIITAAICIALFLATIVLEYFWIRKKRINARTV